MLLNIIDLLKRGIVLWELTITTKKGTAKAKPKAAAITTE